MFLELYQGSAEAIAVTIKDDAGDVVDPSVFYKVEFKVFEKGTNKVIQQFTNSPAPDGYEAFTVNENNVILCYLDRAATINAKPGRLIGQVELWSEDVNFQSGYQVLIYQGVITNLKPAI